VIDPAQTANLRALLNQDQVWVGRARWVRWLNSGDSADTTPISDMVVDDRIASCAWLRKQRHLLYATVEDGESAPDGWVESLPLYIGLGA